MAKFLVREIAEFIVEAESEPEARALFEADGQEFEMVNAYVTVRELRHE